MPRKESISLQNAGKILIQLQLQACAQKDFVKHNWYYENFVHAISESGYHIELTGDEFEVVLAETMPC